MKKILSVLEVTGSRLVFIDSLAAVTVSVTRLSDGKTAEFTFSHKCLREYGPIWDYTDDLFHFVQLQNIDFEVANRCKHAIVSELHTYFTE